MKVLLQRVSNASVSVNGELISSIRNGVLLLTGIAPTDSEQTVIAMAKNLSTLRIFSDDAGKMNRSLLDISGAALVIPQFTLFADLSKGGRRPEFFGAAKPELAKPLCERFVAALKACGISNVGYGIFGADMKVELLNDGPVTIMVEG